MIRNILLVLVLLLVGFGYGITTMKYHFFPYDLLKKVQHWIDVDNSVSFNDSQHIYHKRRVSFFKWHGGSAKNIMLGDSITDDAEWQELFPDYSINNRGIAGDTTADTVSRLSLLSNDAEVVFVLLGTNDIMQGLKLDSILKNYHQIIDELLNKKVTPIIQSTLLLGEQFKHLNNQVEMLNHSLQRIANEKNITYIDLNSVLTADGVLQAQYSIDGIHLNGEGYALWKKQIIEFMQQ
ncbi:GDSL-type esterase/lipase family protein [Zooshikella sp. RANM57]|uniref:GDSL-type esterase/lipase family protein n=1 Tax=Zooshikella sp. RANM57 TaxID=3425863 RepID=UPI003D6EEAA3